MVKPSIFSSKKVFWLVIIGLVVIYLISRLTKLTALPVFADEAIYIRWAQLMNSDFSRYALYPLQDGKTPLQMILLAKWLYIRPLDPLWAARLMSTSFGAVTMILTGLITHLLTKNTKATVMAMFLYLIVPFSLFYDRMGLIDPILNTFIAVMIIGAILVVKGKWWGLLIAGIGLGLSLWTKMSALFIIPGLGLFYYLEIRQVKKPRQKMIWALSGIIIGVLIFGSLKIAPTFGALFARGSDFTFSVSEILAGQWSQIGGNFRVIIKWLGMYLTWFLMIAVIWGGLNKNFRKNNQEVLNLLVVAVVFCLPFIIFGKGVASRYLLPLIVLILPFSAATLTYLIAQKPKWGYLLAVGIMIQSVWFGSQMLWNPAKTPLSHEDKVQYLTEWSAGYGIPEIRDFIKREAVNQRIVVATEGYFGTLPDGLLMYFDKSPLIQNLEIYGIGQPIADIPFDLRQKAKINPTYLVVNSHRLDLNPEGYPLKLIATFPRPLGGPALLLFQVNP